MIDLILCKLFLSKEIFSKYSKIINLEFYKNNNKELYRVLHSLFSLHEKDSKDYTLQDLVLFFYSQYPALKNDEKAIYNNIFSQIEKTEAKEELCIDYLEAHREQTVATQVAMMALDVSRGKQSLGTIIEFLAEQKPVSEDSEEFEFVSEDLADIANEIFVNEGLRWRLETLNKSLGSLRKGDFGFVFARPEIGKTTFLASEVSYMAEQVPVDNPIIWFNNEEKGSKVQARCYQAVFGVTQQELFTNLDHYAVEYSKRLQGRLRIIDEAILTKKYVERVCAKYNPAMIIFDQIDKIYGFDDERYDLKMKAIYQWARELAKTYGPTIGICQAGGTGENKKYLSMNDVDSSHTAKQGEADFILGIGGTNVDGEEFVRYLSISKNKLAGDSDTNPDLRHAKLVVKIIPEIARYSDTMKWS